MDLPTSPFPVRPVVFGQVWMGDVVDPEPFFSRTVSMTWADPCDVEVRAATATMYSPGFLLLSTERESIFTLFDSYTAAR